MPFFFFFFYQFLDHYFKYYYKSNFNIFLNSWIIYGKNNFFSILYKIQNNNVQKINKRHLIVFFINIIFSYNLFIGKIKLQRKIYLYISSTSTIIVITYISFRCTWSYYSRFVVKDTCSFSFNEFFIYLFLNYQNKKTMCLKKNMVNLQV